MFPSKFVEKIKAQILRSITPPPTPPHPKIVQFIRKRKKIWYSQTITRERAMLL
jgi:hypothetical protein